MPKRRARFPWNDLPSELQDVVVSKLDVRDLGSANVALHRRLHPDDNVISILSYALHHGVLRDVPHGTMCLLHRRDRPGAKRLLAALSGSFSYRWYIFQEHLKRPEGVSDTDRSMYPTTDELTKFQVWYGAALTLSAGTPKQIDALLATDLHAELCEGLGNDFFTVFARECCVRNQPLMAHIVSRQKAGTLPPAWDMRLSQISQEGIRCSHDPLGAAIVARVLSGERKDAIIAELLKDAILRGEYEAAKKLFTEGARLA